MASALAQSFHGSERKATVVITETAAQLSMRLLYFLFSMWLPGPASIRFVHFQKVFIYAKQFPAHYILPGRILCQYNHGNTLLFS